MSSAANDTHAWDEDGRRAALAKLDNSSAYAPSPDELQFLKDQRASFAEAQSESRLPEYWDETLEDFFERWPQENEEKKAFMIEVCFFYFSRYMT